MTWPLTNCENRRPDGAVWTLGVPELTSTSAMRTGIFLIFLALLGCSPAQETDQHAGLKPRQVTADSSPGTSNPAHEDSPERSAEPQPLDYIIPPLYDAVDDFADNVTFARIGDEIILIDRDGNHLRGLQCDSTGTFGEGLANVRIGDWGYVDPQGTVRIEPEFDWAGPFQEGLAVMIDEGKHGFINSRGNVVVSPAFDDASGFSEGFAKVKVGDSFGFIDAHGEYVVRPQFASASDFSEGFALVQIGDLFGFIDAKGDTAIPPQYDFARSFSEGLAAVKKGEKWGFIDEKGRIVVEHQFELLGSLAEGLAVYQATVDGDKARGYVDRSGKTVIAPAYTRASEFSEGYAAVALGGAEKVTGAMFKDGKPIPIHGFRGGKWGFIDKKGSVAVDCSFDNVGLFYEGRARVQLDGKWGFIDRRALEMRKGRLTVTRHGSVSGRLVDESGQPLQGAQVRIRRVGDDCDEGECKSDHQGQFFLDGVGRGWYELSASMPRRSATKTATVVEVAIGMEKQVGDIRLASVVEVSGTVRLDVDPLGGAWVVFALAAAHRGKSKVQCNSRGEFIHDLVPGEYKVMAYRDGDPLRSIQDMERSLVRVTIVAGKGARNMVLVIPGG